jgi:hypothetical protein
MCTSIVARLIVVFAMTGLLLSGSVRGGNAIQAEQAGIEIGSAGLIDTDGTVLYGVILTSGSAAAANVTLTGAVPDGARLVEVVQTPQGTEETGAITIVEEGDDAVVWSVPTFPANTILGPFTYRVAFDEPGAGVPPGAPATVRWDGGESEARQIGGQLRPLADVGALTIDEDGTGGLVPVGETGVLIEVPAGVVNGPVTLTFTRRALEDSAELLPDRDDLWWCSLWEITADVPATYTGPIRLSLPNRRLLTPGLTAHGFVVGLGEAGESTTVGVVSARGTHVETFLVELGEIADTIVIGQGVGVVARAIAVTSAEVSPIDGASENDVAGDPGSMSAASNASSLAQTCRGLLANMKIFNRQYWDAVQRGDAIAAQYNRESYYANRHAWDALGCDRVV